MFTIQYLGSRGVRLFSRGAVNLCETPVDANGDCIRPLDQYYPLDPSNPLEVPSATNPNSFDPFGSVDIKRDIGSSTYHGSRVEPRAALSRMDSHSRRATHFPTPSTTVLSAAGSRTGRKTSIACPCEIGPSVFDIRHNFAANTVYELPVGPGKTYLHNDWGRRERSSADGASAASDSTIPAIRSRSPTTYSPSSFPTTTIRLSQRPDLVPGSSAVSAGRWPRWRFSDQSRRIPGPAAKPGHRFSPQRPSQGPIQGAVTRFGDARNGIVRAFPSWQIDLALMKETQVN